MKRDGRLLFAVVLILGGLALLTTYYFALVQWIEAYYMNDWPTPEGCPPETTCYGGGPQMRLGWTMIGAPMILIGAALAAFCWWRPKS